MSARLPSAVARHAGDTLLIRHRCIGLPDVRSCLARGVDRAALASPTSAQRFLHEWANGPFASFLLITRAWFVFVWCTRYATLDMLAFFARLLVLGILALAGLVRTTTIISDF